MPWPMIKLAQRSEPQPRRTLADFLNEQKESAARLIKRKAKAAILWKPRLSRKKALGSLRERLCAQLDNAWAYFIKKRALHRTGGYCEVCLRRPIQVAYHIVPRGDEATRWDLENGVGACSACNFGELKMRRRSPGSIYRRHVKLFGAERIERLVALARLPSNFGVVELEAMLNEIKRRIKERDYR